MKQDDKNDETSNVSMEISQDPDDAEDPDMSNVYEFNDGEDPTQKKTIKEVSLKNKLKIICLY